MLPGLAPWEERHGNKGAGGAGARVPRDKINAGGEKKREVGVCGLLFCLTGWESKKGLI
jgi:hypothetical protein